MVQLPVGLFNSIAFHASVLLWNDSAAAAMSTTAIKSTAAPVTGAGSGPVELLDTSAARWLTHAHAAVLLAGFYGSFASLVADPVSALLNLLAPLAALQGMYVVGCLPAAGTRRGPSPTQAASAGQRTKQRSSAGTRDVRPRIVVRRSMPPLQCHADPARSLPSCRRSSRL